MIVDDTDKAADALSENGITVKATDVIALELPDVPGALFLPMKKLSAAGVNIEYCYAFSGPTTGTVTIVIRTADM